ncbi:MAG: hypothetical protein AAB415_00440 [Patescibacteria group bacterium]
MIISLISILGLTGIVWAIGRRLPFSICPICAGVAGTWLWLISGYFLGYQIDLVITALLMGGTVVGVMSKLERLIEPKFGLIWKTVFVVSGFGAMGSLIGGRWLLFATGIIVALIATFACRTPRIKRSGGESEQIKKLKKEMEKCC